MHEVAISASPTRSSAMGAWISSTFRGLSPRYEWEEPRWAQFFERLASLSRLIRFDKRGTGLSDRTVPTPTLEERKDDVRAVMDAVGSSRAAIFGASEGGAMASLFAATYPQRTIALVLYGTYARSTWAPDYPCGLSIDEWEARISTFRAAWGSGILAPLFTPSLAGDPLSRQRSATFERMSASPGAAEDSCG
jgi:pimeloyl-ACP methyl ester carboxylesterase